MRALLVVVLLLIVAPNAASATPPKFDEFTTLESVMHWIDGYRQAPDPMNLPGGGLTSSALHMWDTQ